MKTVSKETALKITDDIIEKGLEAHITNFNLFAKEQPLLATIVNHQLKEMGESPITQETVKIIIMCLVVDMYTLLREENDNA